MQHSQPEKYPHIGRTIAVPGAPVAANGNSVLAFARDFGPSVGVTLWIQDTSVPVALPAPNPVVTCTLQLSGGYGVGSQIITELGPGCGVKYRVTRQANLSLQQLQSPAGIVRPASNVYLWTTYDTDEQPCPPVTAGALAIVGPAFTPIGPNNGFAPPYRNWLTIDASGNYDLEIRSADGALQYTYLNIVPPGGAFLVPMGHQIGIRPNAGNINIVTTWTEKRNS